MHKYFSFYMKNIGVKYGLLGGVVVIFYFVLLYVAKKELFLHPGLQWASMAFYLIFMYKAAQDDCRIKGVKRDFREILRTPFVVFLLINLAYWLFYYAIHLADPELVSMELTRQIAFCKDQLASGLGDPEQSNKMREQIVELEKALAHPSPQPLGPVLMQMAIGALGGFGLSAGIAALLRRR